MGDDIGSRVIIRGGVEDKVEFIFFQNLMENRGIKVGMGINFKDTTMF